MGRRKKWKVDLLSGQAAALILLSTSFLAGSVIGCVTAGLIHDPAGALIEYVRGCIELMAHGGATPRFLPVLWDILRFPVVAVLLGFTALGYWGSQALFWALFCSGFPRWSGCRCCFNLGSGGCSGLMAFFAVPWVMGATRCAITVVF